VRHKKGLPGQVTLRPAFWLFSILGSSLVIGFAIAQGLSASPVGDTLMLMAIIVCGLGYAEGAKLSKTLGGSGVISWALVLSLPFMAPVTVFYASLLILRDQYRCLDRTGLCFSVQHADRVHFLVPWVIAGRHCCRWAVAVIAAVLRIGPGGYFTA